jgi:hypothetical protein
MLKVTSKPYPVQKVLQVASLLHLLKKVYLIKVLHYGYGTCTVRYSFFDHIECTKKLSDCSPVMLLNGLP